MPKCFHHNLEAVWKTGNAKATGKPYAFWACPVKKEDNGGEWCKEKFNDPAPIGGAVPAGGDIHAKLDKILSILEKAYNVQPVSGQSSSGMNDNGIPVSEIPF